MAFDFSGLITFTPRRAIGPISAYVTLEEVGTDDLQITEHPVELGASITDHAFKRPAEILIRCGWSNASLSGIAAILNGDASTVFGGGGVLFGSDYVSKVYAQLLALQASRQLFDVTTGKRLYRNMLMQSLSQTTDDKSESTLSVTIRCREVLIVQTQVTTLPPREDQASPAATAETVNGGIKQPAPAVPSPGGSAPPSSWTN
ncbi:phage baseplate protein [Chitiniphilus shinanonensis]|uniref:phage baseplate protein n=1 Tax=Chitiniphilus shinanonensis TaxID=553088 RepID=UPI003037BC79